MWVRLWALLAGNSAGVDGIAGSPRKAKGAQRMANPKLEWTDGSERRSFEITSEQTLLGRKSDADVVLTNPYISRHHAKILRSEEGFTLIDLGSTHGTYHNGKRVDRAPLRSGDRIGLGRDRLELHFVGDGGQAGPQPQTSVPETQSMSSAFLDLSGMMPVAADKSELEKLSFLLDFQYQWGRQFSAEGMFHQILANALEISGAERGFVLRRGEGGFEYALGLDADQRTLPEGEFKTSRSIVQEVAEKRLPVSMTEGISGDFAQQESIVAMNLRAAACLPLMGIPGDAEQADLLGILYLDSTKPMHALTGLDQKILAKLASEAGNILEKLEMIRGIEERKRMEQELSLAQETQTNLLPRQIPGLPGFSIRAFSRATRYVGGDFYDFIPLADGRLAGILADVSGKGVSASLLSSSLQGALHMQFRTGAGPAQVLESVNQFVCERSQSNRFVTLFLFLMDDAGQGIYISAGHNPPYVYREDPGQVESLDSSDLVLGAFDFATYTAHSLSLDLGDVLVVYSDGVTEACDPSDDMFGEERLIEIVAKYGPNGAEVVEQELFKALEEFTCGRDQTDDITFIVLERNRASQTE